MFKIYAEGDSVGDTEWKVENFQCLEHFNL